MEEGEKEEIFMTKRLDTSEPVANQARVAVEGDKVMTNLYTSQPVWQDVVQSSLFRICTRERTRRKQAKPKYRGSQSVGQALGKRVKKYDLMNSLAQTSARITFGQILRGDVDRIRKDLQEVRSGKVKSSSLNVEGGAEEDFRNSYGNEFAGNGIRNIRPHYQWSNSDKVKDESETLKLQYEPVVGNDTDDDLTSDSETDEEWQTTNQAARDYSSPHVRPIFRWH